MPFHTPAARPPHLSPSESRVVSSCRLPPNLVVRARLAFGHLRANLAAPGVEHLAKLRRFLGHGRGQIVSLAPIVLEVIQLDPTVFIPLDELVVAGPHGPAGPGAAPGLGGG